MKSRLRGLLLGGGLLVTAAGVLSAYLNHDAPRAPPAAAPVLVAKLIGGPAFSEQQLSQFMDAAQKAETIADPLQRCLAFPNPPGVNWSGDLASMYCHFVLEPAVTSAKARELIEHGHAVELEKQLAVVEKAQLSEPDARSALDRTYNLVFSDGSDDMRSLMDAWKRQSPDNAFALAASGTAYVAMAGAQRGGDFADKTSEGAFEAMHRLLALARMDLDRAVSIDPRLTPAYHAMIHAARMDSDPAYAASAAKQALAVDPANFPVYASLVGMAQPRWGGDVALMNRLIDQAQTHAAENPLLRILLSQRDDARSVIEDCRCDDLADADLYRRYFAEVAILDMLKSAGWAMEQRYHPELSVVYRSEFLRFYPDDLGPREGLTFGLLQLGQMGWALQEGNELVRREPRDANAYGLRGAAYRASGDPVHAAEDYERALRINPGDSSLPFLLGDIYANEIHDWNKGWQIADQLIEANDPRGWLLRAQIQKAEPRDGLDQTIDEFMERFSADPANRSLVERMRSMKATGKVAVGAPVH